MNSRVLQLLEFDKVRLRLAERTSFSVSHDLALALTPYPTLGEAERAQQAADDAATLLRLKPSFSIGGARDVRAVVRQSALGGIIEPLVLLDIGATLASVRMVRETLTRLDDQLTVLGEIASDLVECSAIEVDIQRCIGRRGEVVDSASPQLSRVRQDLRSAHDQLRDKLDSFLASTLGKTILQEPIVTIREGRYVVPIKNDFKGQIRGIVHDTSASGATVFMEPLEVVELNNNLRELEFEEKREVERVLRALAAEIGELAIPIVADIDILGEIDLYVAIARYSREIRAVRPRLTTADEGWELSFREARHPLLRGRVVPISLKLGGNYFILVITGPNTGGKTVALKTTGLLTVMALAGMPVPANDASIPAFDGVEADIGDEQSIEQSLSTFSAHIGNIVRIFENAGPKTLVLLDELGAGTDPAEGAALARAMLGHLVEHRIPAIATTHYSELKSYAHLTPGVQNGSVEFDVDTLAPTYRLAIGLPGASNALAIAARLGLKQDIVEEARSHLSPVQVEIEQMLSEIQTERASIAAERQAAEDARRAAERDRQTLAEALAGIDSDRQHIMEIARAEVIREADEILRTLQRASAIAASAPSSVAVIADAAAEVASARQTFSRRARHPQRTTPRPRPLRIGDTVRIKSLNQIGELLVIAPDRQEAEIRMGSFKARASIHDLEPVSARDASREHRLAHTQIRPTLDIDFKSPGIQLDLRGKRVEEVRPELDQYLNDAYLNGMPTVRVVHGKGTGALRQVVRDQLAAHPLVSSWGPAEQKEGGEGATVARLAI